MGVVIIGGHDRMISRHKRICKNYKCKAKVFTQMGASLNKQIEKPDLLVLFTGIVSHKMIHCALDEVGSGTGVVRCHTSSDTALTGILEEKCTVCAGQRSGQVLISLSRPTPNGPLNRP